jgi:N-sulfoglucosamine sulfohydrolase
VFPTLCELAGIDRPDWLQGHSLLPLVSGTEAPGLRTEIFAELTYHAAYEPQRAIRTDRFKYVRRFDDFPTPVLPNCDDSPSKDAYLARGWAKRPVARESLHDLFFNPGEGRNLVGDPSYQPVLADLRARLQRWMEDTSDPLLEGPVAAPTGAQLNAQDQLSADEPTYTVDAPGIMTRATAA